MMAFLERGEPLFPDAPPSGYGRLAGLGDSRISIVPLLPPAAQAQYAAQLEAKEAASRAAVAADAARTIDYAKCDAAARAAAVAKAKAEGGCVDVYVCDKDGRVVSSAGRQCFDDPRVKAAVVNQIKSDEIEAGCLERMKEMAAAPDANSEENVARVHSEAAVLSAEVDEYRAQVAEDDEALAALARSRDRLAALHGLAVTRRSALR